MAKCNDSWKSKDKLMHCAACLAIALVSPQAAIGAALAKEYGDYKAQGNHWCWKDIAADAVGIVIGTALHLLILFSLFI